MPGFESFSLAVILWIALAVLLAGYLQGARGFCFPFVATPMVAMVIDMRTAVITILLPTLATTIVTLFTSGPLGPVLKRFWMMPVYSILGALIGTWLFVAVPAAPYQLLLALIIIAYLNLDRIARGNWPLIRRHERAFGPLAGAAAGVFEGTANVAAPPLIIYYLALGLAPAMLVQALQICFMVGKATQFTVLTMYGGVTAAQWLATLPLIAIAVAAGFAGSRIRNRIDAQAFRVWVKRALLVIALALLAQYAYQQLAGRF
ncbi:MAG: sulfite exporter TauE/SafE family protein [Betaproteobacteria bacterium]|nr:MAG: sulfite exporter TauE/SafE family protein [Betaproteobacteria bacterium]